MSVEQGRRRRPFWLYRPLLNWQDIYRWGIDAGAIFMVKPEELHTTVATVRSRVDWSLLDRLQDDIIEVDVGEKPMARLGSKAHALTFDHEGLRGRWDDVSAKMPVDHPEHFTGHVTLARGRYFRQPSRPYAGKLIFGPEKIEPFDYNFKVPEGGPINRRTMRDTLGLPAVDHISVLRYEYDTHPVANSRDRQKQASLLKQIEWLSETLLAA